MERGFTVWFTGLPNAGKTTLSRLLYKNLSSRGLRVELLDGNELRQQLSPGLGHTHSERVMHHRRVAYFCRLLNRHGVICLAALIAPYQELRQQIREEIENYLEVFLDCPQEILVARDQKGLYQRALAGEIANFSGISDPYDRPANPDLHLRTDKLSEGECLTRILSLLKAWNHV